MNINEVVPQHIRSYFQHYARFAIVSSYGLMTANQNIAAYYYCDLDEFEYGVYRFVKGRQLELLLKEDMPLTSSQMHSNISGGIDVPLNITQVDTNTSELYFAKGIRFYCQSNLLHRVLAPSQWGLKRQILLNPLNRTLNVFYLGGDLITSIYLQNGAL